MKDVTALKLPKEERALELLVQASRANPTLREAVSEVEKWVRRLQEDRSSAWQSYEEADIEAQYQMGAKLEAQQALWLVVEALDLNPADLPAGWGNATKPILTRVEAIVDEADRLARERDRARHLAKHLFAMVTLEQWRDTGGGDGQGHYEGDYHAAELEEEIRSWPT